eukprot:5069139-Pleurochrysis_carterae.AAC.1
MSCCNNPEANMASNEDTGTPKAGQRELAGLNLSELVGALSLLVHVTAIGGDYDADSMSALATALQRQTVQERGWSSASAATSSAVLPASVMHTTVVASSTPVTAADLVATSVPIPAATSAVVGSQATPPGDSRSS